MKDLKNLLEKFSGGTLLAIFPHPDDESFVAGGLFQATNKLNIKSKLICLTKGELGIRLKKGLDLKKIRTLELKKAVQILGIDELDIWNYPDAKLVKSKSWVGKLRKELISYKPDIVLTFDPSGITGHSDHLMTYREVITIIKKLSKKPLLLLRVPDAQEKKFFRENKFLSLARNPTHELKLGFGESLSKIKAIFSHSSQMPSLTFKLQILEWYLFDHKELYHRVKF